MKTFVALLVSAGGTSMVFGVLLAMNAAAEPPTAEKSVRAIAMDVAPRPKPPKRKAAPKRTQKRTTPKPSAPAPPSPQLAGGIQAVSLGMPTTSLDMNEGGAASLLGNVRASVMTEDSVDSKPRVTTRKAAAYPARARAKGMTGFVSMSLLIGERGNVERIKVLRSEPAGVFEQAAREAVGQWEFEPARYAGEPVKVWANQTVRFQLK